MSELAQPRMTLEERVARIEKLLSELELRPDGLKARFGSTINNLRLDVELLKREVGVPPYKASIAVETGSFSGSAEFSKAVAEANAENMRNRRR